MWLHTENSAGSRTKQAASRMKYSELEERTQQETLTQVPEGNKEGKERRKLAVRGGGVGKHINGSDTFIKISFTAEAIP